MNRDDPVAATVIMTTRLTLQVNREWLRSWPNVDSEARTVSPLWEAVPLKVPPDIMQMNFILDLL